MSSKNKEVKVDIYRFKINQSGQVIANTENVNSCIESIKDLCMEEDLLKQFKLVEEALYVAWDRAFEQKLSCSLITLLTFDIINIMEDYKNNKERQLSVANIFVKAKQFLLNRCKRAGAI